MSKKKNKKKKCDNELANEWSRCSRKNASYITMSNVNPRDEVGGIFREDLPSLRRIIVLV